jgi:hypothetical protein
MIMDKLFDSRIEGKPDYLVLRDDERCSLERANCERLWERVAKYFPRSFPKQFSQDVYSHFFEIYIAGIFLDAGFSLLPVLSEDSPDILINHNNKRIWIEATVPQEGTGVNKVPDIYTHQSFEEIPETEIILRFTSIILTKLNQLQRFIDEKIVTSRDIYILAINSGRISLLLFDADPVPLIVKSLFGIGNFRIDIDLLKPEIRSYFNLEPIRFKNTNQNPNLPILSALFLDKKYELISGILYSNDNLWNFPEKQKQKFHLIHNFNAINPLFEEWSDFFREWKFNNNRLIWPK